MAVVAAVVVVDVVNLPKYLHAMRNGYFSHFLTNRLYTTPPEDFNFENTEINIPKLENFIFQIAER